MRSHSTSFLNYFRDLPDFKLVAVAVFIWMLIFPALASAAGAGTSFVQICTLYGVETIAVENASENFNDAPISSSPASLPVSPPTSMMQECPLCLGHAIFPPKPLGDFVSTPVLISQNVSFLSFQVEDVSHPYPGFSFDRRGPPII